MHNYNHLISGNRGSATIGGISKGEMVIQKTLQKIGAKYYRESKYQDCRGGSANLPLPFDFSVYFEGKLVALVEYQGIQHSLPTFGMGDWDKVRNTDEIKREYCKSKGIPLLAVPYHKFKDIESIVTKFLQQEGILKKIKMSFKKSYIQ